MLDLTLQIQVFIPVKFPNELCCERKPTRVTAMTDERRDGWDALATGSGLGRASEPR
jgi:hypothetical protein